MANAILQVYLISAENVTIELQFRFNRAVVPAEFQDWYFKIQGLIVGLISAFLHHHACINLPCITDLR